MYDRKVSLMKKAIFLGALFIIICIIILLIKIENSENRIPQISDLNEYPEFKLFIIGMEEFHGISQNFDSNEYSFYYKTTINDEKTLFEVIDENAKSNDWQISVLAKNEKLYKKREGELTNAVNIKYVDNKYVYFNYEEIYNRH